MNFLRTAHRAPGLLDVQMISEDDIAAQPALAERVAAQAEAGRRLPLGGTPGSRG
jgi:hypothetical protein